MTILWGIAGQWTSPFCDTACVGNINNVSCCKPLLPLVVMRQCPNSGTSKNSNKSPSCWSLSTFENSYYCICSNVWCSYGSCFTWRLFCSPMVKAHKSTVFQAETVMNYLKLVTKYTMSYEQWFNTLQQCFDCKSAMLWGSGIHCNWIASRQTKLWGQGCHPHFNSSSLSPKYNIQIRKNVTWVIKM